MMKPAGTAAVAAIIGLTMACVDEKLPQVRGDAQVPPPARDSASLLLVTLDTFREDASGVGGDPVARTPHLDRLARTGIQFRGIAGSPLTLPSHASMLTGLNGPAHGIRDNGTFRLPADIPTFVAPLGDVGFATGAFITAFPLDRRFGLSRGFAVYDDDVAAPEGAGGFLMAQRSGAEGVEAWARWLDGLAPPTRWFAWLHLFDAHQPYDAPKPLLMATADNPYRADVAMTDGWLGRAVRAATERGSWVIVIGDHGESLGDHGEGSHGIFIYESTIRIPAILWPAPDGEPPGLRRDVFRTIDVPATCFELLGLPPGDAPGEGASALSPGDRPAYMETYYPFFHFGWSRLAAVQNGDWKYVDAPDPELYDLFRDPGETENLADEFPERAERLAETLRDISSRERVSESIELDPAAREALESLGYATTRSEASEARPDPKRMVGVLRLMETAQVLMAEGRWDEALTPLRSLVGRDPRNKGAYQMLGVVHARAGRDPQAADSFLRCLELSPHANDRIPRFELASTYLRMGKNAEAIIHLKKVLDDDPNDADVWYNLGVAQSRRGDAASARSAWEKALGADPAHTLASQALGGH
jgi:arylsulfatase A-like enzyme/predicted negative regulator of RcsB-dependent stress response